MADLVIFNILIPRADNWTGALHPQERFKAWVRRTVEQFGGLTVAGLSLQGYWYDRDLPPEANPVTDRSNSYKIGVEPARIGELRAHVEQTARAFGQKCIYFERAGEAEYVWDPAHRPSG